MTNRNPVKQLFITFPHSNVDKQTFRDTLLRFEPEYYKICEEKHKDGSPHLHAVVKFKNKYSKVFVLKYFKEQYPDDYKRIDVKPVRSIKNSIAYLSKEDDNPLESGEYQESRNPQLNWLNKFARELGHTDSKTLVEDYKRELSNLEQIKAKVHEEWIWRMKFPEYSPPPYDILRIYEKLFADKAILKDDMTYFLNYLQIKV